MSSILTCRCVTNPGFVGGGAQPPHGAPPLPPQQQQPQGGAQQPGALLQPFQQPGALLPQLQQQQPIPHPPLPPSVRITLVLCGVPDVGLFDGKTPAQRMAADIFFDDFLAVLDTTHNQINDALKA